VSAPDVQRVADAAPFDLVAAPNGDAWIRLSDRDVSPQEVSALVLEQMRRVAEDAVGELVTQAVITVPAYFDDVQRQATRDAGRIAGLDVRRILSEPTAAALAYGAHRRAGRQRLAVFDLGGGTFDVSILEIEAGMFQVLAVNGDMSLGGDDFDRRLVARLLEVLGVAGANELAGDPVGLGRLREAAEKAKRVLSDVAETRVQLQYAGRRASGEPVHLDHAITRQHADGEEDHQTGDAETRAEGADQNAHGHQHCPDQEQVVDGGGVQVWLRANGRGAAAMQRSCRILTRGFARLSKKRPASAGRILAR
jgi:molecular chaperone DnaK